jgi:hypothetical protein
MGGSIMEQALGPAWARLGSAVRQHYDIAPGADERRVMHGTMRVSHAWWATPVLTAGRIFGALLDRAGEGIPVRVENWTARGSRALHWHRTFAFPLKPIVFRSRMEHAGGDEIVEYVRGGLGIRMRLSEQEGALVYEGIRYQWDLGPLSLPIPDWLLAGKASIREWSLDEERFAMEFHIRHPLFGEAFCYAGEFRLSPQ